MENGNALDTFISGIDSEKWNDLEPVERLKVLQEFENVMAARCHREPVEIRVLPPDYAENNPGTLGFYNHQNHVIAIRMEYLICNNPVQGISRFSMARALETIAHEGRHAWQYYVVEHEEKGIVSEADRLAMKMNFENYQGGKGGFNAYAAQLVEMDARRFARETMEYMLHRKEMTEGKMDTDLLITIHQARAAEFRLASQVVDDLKFKDYILKLEAKARKISGYGHKDEDYSEISYFSAIKKLFQDKDIIGFMNSGSVKLKAASFSDGRETKFDGRTLKEKTEDMKAKIRTRYL